MQFLILLTGVLVFVFYHFQPPPLLWNLPTLGGWSGGAAAELAAVRERFEAAHAAGRPRAGRRTRWRGPRSQHGRVPGGERAVDAARSGGGRVGRGARPGTRLQRHQLHLSVLHPGPRCRGGLAGLVIAVIFAAAMSTLSGELNSLATATMVDFYKRFVRPQADAAQELLVPRADGVLGRVRRAGGAARRQLGSAIEVVNRFGSYFYGSILGVFLLAVLTRVGASAAFAAILVGEAVVMALAVTAPCTGSGSTSSARWRWSPPGCCSSPRWTRSPGPPEVTTS